MFEHQDQSRNLLTDQVYRNLRKAIIEGQLLAGARLKENEIAEAMSVSRTPVREALNRLKKEGLVTGLKSGGVTVNKISVQDVIEIIELRQLLEAYAIRCIKQRLSHLKIEELGGIQFGARVALQNGDLDQVIRLDAEYHKWLVRASGNRKLYEMTSLLGNFINIGIQLKCYNLEEAAKSIQEHERITECLVRKDFQAAEKILVDHLELAKNLILARIEPDEIMEESMEETS